MDRARLYGTDFAPLLGIGDTVRNALYGVSGVVQGMQANPRSDDFGVQFVYVDTLSTPLFLKQVSLVKRKIMESAKKTKMIILHGADLVHFHVYIKHPETFKVKLNKSPAIIKKLDEILQLILDIYISMSQKLATRVDFFTRPDPPIKRLLDMLEQTKKQLIKFIIKHRDGGGGGETVPSFTAPLDEMIGDLDLLAIDAALSTLPSVSSLAKIPTSLKTKTKGKKVGMTSTAGKRKKTRRKHHLKKTIHKREH